MFHFDKLNFDFDGDGVLDSYAEFMDSNGDGIVDYAEIDFDGDGNADAVFLDSNHDGAWDAGMIDSDTDGVLDTELFDADGDGIMDTAVTYQDFDGDGNEDLVITEKLTGAGLHSVETVAGTYADDLGNFNPAHADMDRVCGEPESAMEEWEYQGDTGRCALYAQKFVIEELTDTEIDMEELAKLAQENGWFSEEGGTPMLNMDRVLDYYGIDSDMSFYNNLSDIEECLEAGGKIIVAVDADEIWYGEQDDLFTPGDGANHAVEVIGIDRTNPDDTMVILNDSGNPNGCGELVPLETFLDAWEDGNCQMITCMNVCAHQG